MNSVLLSVGVAVVLALFAALIGPFLVDWNAYKYILEARLSEAAGRPVSVGRVVELRLLPTPVLKADGLRIAARGKDGARPLLTAPRIEARLALAPILSGEVEINRLVIERPLLELGWRGDGSVDLPGFGAAGSPIDPGRVSLDAIEVREGSVMIRDEQTTEVRTLSGLNLTGEAVSLGGPFKAEGGLLADGTLYTFRLATGRVQEDGAVRTKLTVQPASGSFELALDGLLSATGGRPAFNGAARLQRLVPALAEDVPPSYRGGPDGVAWRATMEVEATPLAVAVRTLALAIGRDERAVQFSGSGRIDLHPAPRMELEMQANQIDLDRALGHGPGGRAAVGELGAVAAGLRTWIEALDMPLSLRLKADAALINGSLAEDLELAADIDAAKVTLKNFLLRLPGKSVLSGKGVIALDAAAPALDAMTQLETRQAGLLLQWLGLQEFRVGTLRVRPGTAAVVARARLGLSGGALRLDDIEAQLDDSAIAGRLLYQSRDGAPRRLDLALAVDALDLGRYFEIVPREAAGAAGAEADQERPPPEIALRLDAEELSLGDVAARGLTADLVYSAGSLTVNSLSLADLGGTSLAASGRIDDLFADADGELTASLTSDDLTGVAKLAADLGLTGLNGADLSAQAAAISPAAVEAVLKASRSDGGSELEANLSAALGGTVAKARATFRGRLAEIAAGTIDLAAEASNPDGDRLLAQLSLPAGASGGGKLPGRLRLDLSGPLSKGARLSAEAGLLGVAGRVDGTLTMASEAAFSGKFRLGTPDARTLLGRLDLPGKDAALPQTAEIAGAIDRQGPLWRLDGVEGRAGRETFSGELQLDLPDEGPRRFDGRLDFDTLSLPWLFAALLGAETGAPGPGTWPQAPFDLAATRPLPGRLAVSANRLALPGGVSAGGARFDLVLEAGSAAFADVRARLYGGEAAASLRLAESALDRGLSLTADISLKDAVIGEMAWAPGGAPVATGTVDLTTRIAGTGRSWLGLVSSLTGEGTFAARDGVLRGLDPDAFVRVVKAAGSGLELKEDRVLDVFKGYLAAGALAYDRFEGVFEVNEGIISAKNVALRTGDAGLIVSTLVDLPELRLDSEWTLTPGAGEEMAAVPPVTLVFAGPLSAPQRQLDVNALTGYLTVRRLEEDVRRLEMAQADALERERFDRLLLRQTQDHMRRAREKRERERLEAERLQAEQLRHERAEALRRQAAREQAARLEAERTGRERREQAARREAQRAAIERRETVRRQAAREQAARREAERIERERRKAEAGSLPAGNALQLAPSPPIGQTPLDQLVTEALRNSLVPETPGAPLFLRTPVTPPQATEPGSGLTPAAPGLSEPINLAPTGLQRQPADLQPPATASEAFQPSAQETPGRPPQPRRGSINLPYDPVVDPGG